MASFTQTYLGNITQALRQNKSAQDFVTNGRNIDEEGGEFLYIVVADGHGNGLNKDKVINFIRYDYDWKTHLKDKNWYEAFNMALTEQGDTENSGATLSVVRIYEDHFDCWWIGDSSIRIYDEEGEFWRTKDHSSTNQEEIERLKQMGYKILDDQTPLILTPTTITMVPACRVEFGPRERIGMTHTLGHNKKSGDFICYKNHKREKNVSYRIIVASDGFWDVVHNIDVANFIDRSNFHNADKLLWWCWRKWTQEWNYQWNGKCQKTKFPEWNIDDIAISVFDC